MFCENPLKKDTKTMKKNMKKVILFKVPPTISFVKKVKLLISSKNAFKTNTEIVKKNVKKHILLKHPPSRSFVKKRVPLKICKTPFKKTTKYREIISTSCPVVRMPPNTGPDGRLN